MKIYGKKRSLFAHEKAEFLDIDIKSSNLTQMPESIKQVADQVSKSGSILIVLPPQPSADAIAASLALSSYLKKTEKEVTIVSTDGNLNAKADFLPGYSGIMRGLSITKSFVIEISTKRTKISELSYKKNSDSVSVHLKPKDGEFTPEDVSFASSKFPYDAVIVLGTPNLESLGDFYGKHAELFFTSTVINIDFKGANEGYGQFNLVDLNATSISEIVFDLVSEMEREMIDQQIATQLLAGIIAETNSFQHARTTPQSFIKASQLVGLGGDQQEIVNNLYKNKSMGFLKLWGRVLARLKNEPDYSLVYSAVNNLDVEKAGAENSDVSTILKEMQLQLSFAKVFVFMREINESLTEVFAAAPSTLNLSSAFSKYQPDSTVPNAMHFLMGKPLAETEAEIIQEIKNEAKKLAK